MPRPLDTVNKALRAYLEKDRAAIEAVIADEYSFTSPLDNAIGRETYFARCWPNSAAMTEMNFIDGAEHGDYAWVTYETATKEKRFRNTELHRVKNGKIVETQVFFGWDLPHKAPARGFIDP